MKKNVIYKGVASYWFPVASFRFQVTRFTLQGLQLSWLENRCVYCNGSHATCNLELATATFPLTNDH